MSEEPRSQGGTDDDAISDRRLLQSKALAGIGLVFGIVLFGALATVVVHFGDIAAFAKIMGEAKLVWLIPALALQVTTYGLAAWAWRAILSWLGVELPLKSLIILALVQLYGNQALPTAGLAGATLVASGLHRRGVKASTVLSVLSIAAIAYLLAYLLMTTAAVLLFWERGNLTPVWEWTLTAFSLCIACGVAGMLLLLIYGNQVLPLAYKRWPGLGVIDEHIRALPVLDKTFTPVLLTAVTMYCLVFLSDSLTLWSCTNIVGKSVSPVDAIIAHMLASVTATLSPVPMGLGTFDAAATGLLHAFGAGLEAAFSATVVFRIFTLWLPMAPGLVFTRKEMLPASTPGR